MLATHARLAQAARMTAATPRLFLAAAPGPENRAELTRLRRQLHDLPPARSRPRWTAPGNLHLTLRYFGAADDDQRRGIEALAARAAGRWQPFALPFAGLAAWPPERPRVLVAEYSADPTLTALATELESGARQLGFAPESRALRPHVSLARLRANAALAGMPPSLTLADFAVTALTLYDRAAGPEANGYIALGAWPLGATGPL